MKDSTISLNTLKITIFVLRKWYDHLIYPNIFHFINEYNSDSYRNWKFRTENVRRSWLIKKKLLKNNQYSTITSLRFNFFILGYSDKWWDTQKLRDLIIKNQEWYESD